MHRVAVYSYCKQYCHKYRKSIILFDVSA